MSPDKLEQAISLIKSGDKESGGSILLEIIKSDPRNENAWLWMSSIVSKDKRILCLEKALSINPNNVQAKQYLEKLKAGTPGEQTQLRTGSRIKPGSNTDSRSAGLFLLLIGIGVGYWQIVMPIMQALNHEPSIEYSSKGVVLGPTAILLGGISLIFGKGGLGFLSKKPSKLGVFLLLIGIVVYNLVCIIGMTLIMGSLGYR